MDTQKKLELLAQDAQYDLACACGTTKNSDHRKRGDTGWLYPVTVPGGGTGIMLKTLMTNVCVNDCRYCPLRADADRPRLAVQPERLARFFMDSCVPKGLIGIFLSSGVVGNADRTMKLLNDTAAILRKSYQYRGYIHIKIIPGASAAAIEHAVSLASAVSLNIETPGASHFAKLSQNKHYLQDIIEPLKTISALTAKGTRYKRVKKTTQFIVGASDENDREILNYLWGLYKRLDFSRIYFSSYQYGLGDPSIPGEQKQLQMLHTEPPVVRKAAAAEPAPLFSPESAVTPLQEAAFVREHRLYQADFLVRKYGFALEDFSFQNGQLSLEKDPKQVWADQHPEFFPVSLKHGSRNALLRVPGLGPTLVNRIITQRKTAPLAAADDVRMQKHLAAKARPYLTA